MSHTLHINHAKGEADRPGRAVHRAASGRIASDASAISVDSAALAQEMKAAIAGEVRFDDGSRALYATDASNYRQVPIGVVIPKTLEDAVTAIALCRKFGAPLVMRGGGTSLAGQGCNVAVLIDFSKYLNRVLDIDPKERRASVEPGCVLDTLRDAAEQHHLTFGPDPATHDHNTLGGMIGNNSCGVHSIMSGRTSDNVESLDIVTYDGLRMTVGRTSDAEFKRVVAEGGRRGAIYLQLDEFRKKYGDLIRARYPRIPRRVSGYENLDELLPENGFNVARALVGTESTCVTVLQARLELDHSPPERVLAIIGFDDVFEAADAVPEALEFGPIGLEGMDQMLVDFVREKHLHPEDVRLLPNGNGWLIAEFGADNKPEADEKARKFVEHFRQKGNPNEVLDDKAEQKKIWIVREAALAATAHVPGWPDTYPGWEDSAVPRAALGHYLRDLKKLFHQHGYDASVYGHFGDGLVHCRVPFDLRTEKGLENWQAFLEEAAALVARYGGSISGEHGDGQARGALLETMYGAELVQAFREFKSIWDPEGRMNPGKVIDPFPPTSNLRIGPEYQPPEVETYFAFSEDGGSFTKATRRCVGVGMCRRNGSDHGVMCPSYMATMEERHSTRGRARLLFEMLHGGPIENRWESAAVEEALDLCLGCKGCKSDCPVSVDMATYKAEFRAHHYRNRLRPRAAYSMGLIRDWSRIASEVPWLANAILQTPGIASMAKWIGGIAQQRHVPRYASQTFTQWFRQRRRTQRSGPRVMLWPDTFNNYFRPETAIAATSFLEKRGYHVVIPSRPLCCGRPLYDWGFLDKAKKLWSETMDCLLPEIENGTPLIGLEPSCVSAFRDELPGLFPGNERAQRLAENTKFITEFAAGMDENLLPRLGGKALVQIHCHHHAIIKPAAQNKVLDTLGIDREVLPSGCCGMAGAFGFEAGKYGVAMVAGERVLLPAVRNAHPDTTILANGFSCREQIEQGTGRTTRHIAELLGSITPRVHAF